MTKFEKFLIILFFVIGSYFIFKLKNEPIKESKSLQWEKVKKEETNIEF